MSQPELLKRVVDVLGAAGVEYMVTGSVVSSSQGQPRSTHDIDLVVNITIPAAMKLVAAFPPPDYYLDDAAARTAIAGGDMFNLLDNLSGDKVDFWILKNHPYDRDMFSRRIRWNLAGIETFVSSPENTILQKLRWAEMCGGSEKQFQDAKSVYELQCGALDLLYIERWVRSLQLQDSWDRIKREGRPIS